MVKDSLAEEAGFLMAGAAVTLGLFLGLAHFQRNPRPAPAAPPEDLRAIFVPLEPPPPPPPLSASSEPSAPAPLALGLEASPAESAVHLAVTPLTFDLPSTPVNTAIEINVARVYPEFKPGAEMSINEQSVYQEADVDQPPLAVKRSLQFIPHALRVNLTQIHVVLIMLLEKDGRVSSVRVVQSCGTAALDEIAARSVKEDWAFTPAIKRGKPVRCFVQQPILFKMIPGSLLEPSN